MRQVLRVKQRGEERNNRYLAWSGPAGTQSKGRKINRPREPTTFTNGNQEKAVRTRVGSKTKVSASTCFARAGGAVKNVGREYMQPSLDDATL